MLVIAGKNNIAVNALAYAKKNSGVEIAVVCNENDDGAHGWQRSLKKTAQDCGVRIVSLTDAYDCADVFISLEFDKIIKPEKFSKARAYNIHFSLLPKYKGMYTSIWPILNYEKESGVTLHEIDAGIDTGPIVAQKKFSILDSDRASDLYCSYLKYGYELFTENFANVLFGHMASRDQSRDSSTYYSKSSLDLKSFQICFNQTAHTVRKQIFSFCFRPYQLPIVDEKKIVGAEILGERSLLKPGMVLRQGSFFIDFATIDYNIRLYFDRIADLHQFSSCGVHEADELLNGFAGVHDRNDRGWSPIIVAAYNGNVEVVKYLLRRGANVNDVNFNGTSVLMFAKEFVLRSRCKEIFDLLTASGANIGQKDFFGKSLSDYLTHAEIEYLGINR